LKQCHDCRPHKFIFFHRLRKFYVKNPDAMSTFGPPTVGPRHKWSVGATSNCKKGNVTSGDVNTMFASNRTITRWFATTTGAAHNWTNCSSNPTKCGQGHLGVGTHPSDPMQQVILFQRKKQAIEHLKLLLHLKCAGKKEIVSLFLSGSNEVILHIAPEWKVQICGGIAASAMQH